jgi:hypothetical protein
MLRRLISGRQSVPLAPTVALYGPPPACVLLRSVLYIRQFSVVMTEENCHAEEKESDLTPFLPPSSDLPSKPATPGVAAAVSARDIQQHARFARHDGSVLAVVSFPGSYGVPELAIGPRMTHVRARNAASVPVWRADASCCRIPQACRWRQRHACQRAKRPFKHAEGTNACRPTSQAYDHRLIPLPPGWPVNIGHDLDE